MAAACRKVCGVTFFGFSAGGEALLFGALHGVSSHGDDRHVAAPQCFVVAYGGGGFQTVHFGHLNVHEDHVEGFGLPRGERGLCASGADSKLAPKRGQC